VWLFLRCLQKEARNEALSGLEVGTEDESLLLRNGKAKERGWALLELDVYRWSATCPRVWSLDLRLNWMTAIEFLSRKTGGGGPQTGKEPHLDEPAEAIIYLDHRGKLGRDIYRACERSTQDFKKKGRKSKNLRGK